jgi:hypothetical protein
VYFVKKIRKELKFLKIPCFY